MGFDQKKSALDYKTSGVDIRVADRFVERIGALVKPTLNKRVKKSIGGYASLYEIDKKTWLAASTDGVGTKLKLALQLGDHRTVGIDLVAMSVNDVLCVGAKPLFFLDYFATSKLDPHVGEQIVQGIVEGCKQAGCALVGGETAEMPDFYAPGEYDLAGFAVGTVPPKKVLPKTNVKSGDVLIGLPSSGLHSNGYSLARKLLAQHEPNNTARARELLTPTRIYAKTVLPLVEKGWLKGLAHLTGSGFLNLPRVSERHHYHVALPSLADRAPIFTWIYQKSGLELAALAETFNCGVGMVLVVDLNKTSAVQRYLRSQREAFFVLGEVGAKIGKGQKPVVWIQDPSLGKAMLEY